MHACYLYLREISILISLKGHKIAKSIVIGVTGTPAAGKSTFAKEILGELPESEMIELNDIVDRFKLFSDVDKLGSKIVRLKELEAKMAEIIKEKGMSRNIIVVGHLVPEIKLKYDLIVVVRVNLKGLISRMERRNYQKEKIRENLVSESIDYCGVKSSEMCAETYEIENEEERRKVLNYIKERSAGKSANKPEAKEISKMDELLELVTEGNRYGL
ncbi:TPA: AAA family ATPase [Candidatus Micrarchaeota archaeon]|nr:AAA family ATPase [Candidatus Micrarchaeota archaeon]